jgi:hypothetical protein
MLGKEKIETVIVKKGQKITVEQKFKNDWHRAEGFLGKGTRQEIDTSFPACPFCKTAHPKWEWRNVTEKVKGGLKAKLKGGAELYGGGSIWNAPALDKRIHFRCPNCEAILSRGRGKIMWRIESVGKHDKLQHLIHEEYLLEVLQGWAKTTSPKT